MFPACSFCVGCSVGAVAVITVLVSAWICFLARQTPHQLETPQLNAFRAATAASENASSTAAEAATSDETAADDAASRTPALGITCPVCLNDVALAVQANCGHWYCGTCIIAYWHHSSRVGGQLRCPCCRRGITLLHSGLTRAESESEEGIRLTHNISQYNRRHSGLPVRFLDRLRDTPTLLQWLLAELFSPRGTALLLALHFTLPAVGSVLGAVAYVLSPIDLLPDFSVIGLLDDVIVFLLLLVFISSLYRTQQAAEESRSAHHD